MLVFSSYNFNFNTRYKYTEDNKAVFYSANENEDIKYEIEFDTIEELVEKLKGVSLLESL